VCVWGGLPRDRVEPNGLGARLFVNALGHVAVTLADDGDEERSGLFDPLEADGQRLIVLGLVFGDTPAQVHVEKLQPQLFDAFAQFREDDGDQVVPLRMHVAEGGGDEDADGFPRCAHTKFLSALSQIRNPQWFDFHQITLRKP